MWYAIPSMFPSSVSISGDDYPVLVDLRDVVDSRDDRSTWEGELWFENPPDLRSRDFTAGTLKLWDDTREAIWLLGSVREEVMGRSNIRFMSQKNLKITQK